MSYNVSPNLRKWTYKMEEWKPSPLCFDHVETSNLGRARTLDRTAISYRYGVVNKQVKKGKILSPWISKNGYLTISVKVGDKRTKFLLHRLVASAFVDGFNRDLTVNHKDGNKLNNNSKNLEWVTLQENTKHEWETGLVDIRGDKHPSHILTDDEVRMILERKMTGEKVAEIYKDYNKVCISLIYKICQGVKRNRLA